MTGADALRKAMEEDVNGIPSAEATYKVTPPAGIPRRAMPVETIEKVVEIIPANAMLVNNDGTITVGSYTLTGTGLMIGDASNFDEWQAVGNVLLRIEASIQWLIGDWINQGEFRWGQTYQQIEEITGKDYDTLKDYAYVARKVNLSVRTDKLSFGHHKLVAAMDSDQQGYWLEQAAVGGWSISTLRKALKPANEGDDSNKDEFATFASNQLKAAKKLDRPTLMTRVSQLRELLIQLEQVLEKKK